MPIKEQETTVNLELSEEDMLFLISGGVIKLPIMENGKYPIYLSVEKENYGKRK